MKNIAETESNRVEAETGIPEEVQLLVDALDDKRAVQDGANRFGPSEPQLLRPSTWLSTWLGITRDICG